MNTVRIKTSRRMKNQDSPEYIPAGRQRFRRLRNNYELLLLSLPAIIYFIIFHYIPMAGIVIAFKDYKYNLGLFASRWVGIDNFRFFFISQDAFRITRNTVGYSIIFIITGICCSVIIALLLFELTNKFALKFFQTTMILPYFLSWVIVGFITYILFNPVLGVSNQLLNSIGLKEIDWYSEPKYWPFILTLVNLWKSIGLNSIIYYAALMGIGNEIYEAAIIDGASRWKQTLHISIPSLYPIMTILSILSIGNMFRGDFGLFYQIPRDVGALYPTTDIIDTYIYRGLRGGDIGITAAVGFFQSFVGLFLVVAANSVVRKIQPDNSMF